MSDTGATFDLSRPPSSRTSGPGKRRGGSWIKWLVLLLLLGGIGWGAKWYLGRAKESPLEVRTAAISRGNILQEVTANGSLTAVKMVEVGSQVSGIIQELKVDFNSRVKEGDLLARIDPSSIQQNLVQAEAELGNSQASLELAELNYRRAKELFKANLISAAEHDAGLAALHQAEAGVKIRQASIERVKVDLSHTSIYAPISGVVISRNVDQGQTVAASFNTPRLFVIANDLSKMQIEAAVSEADVGGVEEGQAVSFSVDAFPSRRFQGRVQQVRYAAVTNQSVVTYTTVVGVDNPDLKLRPGMTATAKIETGRRDDVLRVPSAALRFRPPAELKVTGVTNAVSTGGSGGGTGGGGGSGRFGSPEEREKFLASLTPEQREQMAQGRGRRGGGGGRGGDGAPRAAGSGPASAILYLQDKNADTTGTTKTVARGVSVRIGITDGSFTEVIDGVNEGDTIIIGASNPSSSLAATPNNPFAPNFGGGRGSGPGGGGGRGPR